MVKRSLTVIIKEEFYRPFNAEYRHKVPNRFDNDRIQHHEHYRDTPSHFNRYRHFEGQSDGFRNVIPNRQQNDKHRIRNKQTGRTILMKPS